MFSPFGFGYGLGVIGENMAEGMNTGKLQGFQQNLQTRADNRAQGLYDIQKDRADRTAQNEDAVTNAMYRRASFVDQNNYQLPPSRFQDPDSKEHGINPEHLDNHPDSLSPEDRAALDALPPEERAFVGPPQPTEGKESLSATEGAGPEVPTSRATGVPASKTSAEHTLYQQQRDTRNAAGAGFVRPAAPAAPVAAQAGKPAQVGGTLAAPALRWGYQDQASQAQRLADKAKALDAEMRSNIEHAIELGYQPGTREFKQYVATLYAQFGAERDAAWQQAQELFNQSEASKASNYMAAGSRAFLTGDADALRRYMSALGQDAEPFVYAMSNPVMKTDPYGKQTNDIEGYRMPNGGMIKRAQLEVLMNPYADPKAFSDAAKLVSEEAEKDRSLAYQDKWHQEQNDTHLKAAYIAHSGEKKKLDSAERRDQIAALRASLEANRNALATYSNEANRIKDTLKGNPAAIGEALYELDRRYAPSLGFAVPPRTEWVVNPGRFSRNVNKTGFKDVSRNANGETVERNVEFDHYVPQAPVAYSRSDREIQGIIRGMLPAGDGVTGNKDAATLIRQQ